MATRAMLVESSRAEERLRISRDLHDTLGHHLTALSLQLDVAPGSQSGQAEGHIRRGARHRASCSLATFETW